VYETIELVVTVKAYPAISEKYGEVVRVAGSGAISSSRSRRLAMKSHTLVPCNIADKVGGSFR
jgi:hypothetical protein